MTPFLLDYLCDPNDQSGLSLIEARYDEAGNITEGVLVSESGNRYRIVDGVPVFVENMPMKASVDSFGDEWNYFNFDQFKLNWLNHTVINTFGSADAFKGKVIVDAGGGSGMQSLWMSQSGARHIICLELSHSVDGVMKENVGSVANIDRVQCSIDCPPIREGSIDGIVFCHNVIQHTPSVENTARALWRIVGKGGEFVFNCYRKLPGGFLDILRYCTYDRLREILPKRSFTFILNYSRIVSALRFIPVLGKSLEVFFFVCRGHVPKGENYFSRAYRQGVLNTFDLYGSHTYQHLKTDEEIKRLISELQPDGEKISNYAMYFSRQTPDGCALRLKK